MQEKQRRVIQEKAVRKVGEEHEQPIDVRIVSASHHDLSQRVEQQKFRQDLFFRLNVIHLEVPRLAERAEDVPELAQHFVSKYAREWGMPNAELSDKAMAALCRYHFPGNVRELENILQRAFTMAENDSICLDDLNLPSSPASKTSAAEASLSDESSIITNNLEQYLENIERRAITQALEETRWNKTAAAEKLGISFRALRSRCKKLGID